MSRVDSHLAECLHGVGVEHGTRLSRGSSQCGDVLNDPDFVVHPHHTGHGGLVIEQGGKVLGIHQTIARDAHQMLLTTFLGDAVDGSEHRLVFDGRGDGRGAPAGALGTKGAQDGEVVTPVPPR